MKKTWHYISKYSLLLLCYFVILAVSFAAFTPSLLSFLIPTIIYSLLIHKKIIVFSSRWLD